MTRFRKSLFITAGVVFLAFVLVILFISPITKYLVEKYDLEYTGRQITMDVAYVNPFTGFIHFRNLKIYEANSDSIFFSTTGFSVNIAMIKLFSKTYEITHLKLENPKGILIKEKDKSNLDDLINKFSSKENEDTLAPPVHFNVLNVVINDGEFHIRDNLIPVNYFIRDLSLKSKGKKWDSDSVDVEFSFESGIGSGEAAGNFSINLSTNRYRMDTKITKFDLNIIEQYLKDLTNYGTFSATLDADVKTSGSLDDKKDITIIGLIALNDFHFGKTRKVDYASFKKLSIGIKEVSPKKFIFYGDSLLLKEPFFRYEKYDSLDNLQTMFGKNGENLKEAEADSAQFNLIIEIADFVRDISEYFFRSHYQITRLAINDGDIQYNDYSASEKFSMALDPLYIYADSIDKNHPWVYMTVNSGVKPYGKMNGKIRINPNDSSDFDLEYHFNDMPLSMFNPYTISATSFPFDRGIIECNGNWTVRDGDIDSQNHLVIIDPRLTKKLRNKEINFIPMRPVMALIREQGNVIDYEIPIRGNLRNPKFSVWDIVTDVLENIFVKPVKTNYRIHVKHVETEIEKSLTLRWPMRKSTLLPPQEKFAEKMASFLKENPDARIDVYPQLYESKEKEYILFFEAKKRYYLSEYNKTEATFNEEDSAFVEKMSIKDIAFKHYLHSHIRDSLKFTIQEKCAQLINDSIINKRYDQLNQARQNRLAEFFQDQSLNKQLHFHEPQGIIPFNGFSFFKISYNDQLPKSLLNAYNDMEELNETPPRRKFKREHEKNVPEPEVNTNIKKDL